MEPNNVTCRPQLIKILLASSLCLSDLDLIQLKAESAAELEREKNVLLFVLPTKVLHPSSEPINL